MNLEKEIMVGVLLVYMYDIVGSLKRTEASESCRVKSVVNE